jgi:hypothetical protein
LKNTLIGRFFNPGHFKTNNQVVAESEVQFFREFKIPSGVLLFLTGMLFSLKGKRKVSWNTGFLQGFLFSFKAF